MNSEKKYFPQLDSIRGISVLAVFIFHAYTPKLGDSLFEEFIVFILAHLGMGLDVFFILSAFLLTLLGMNEFEKTGKFSLKNYCIRRVLRIWPLYFLLMFFSFVVLPIVQHYSGHQLTLPPAYWYLFFISNFYLPDHVFFLRLLWTLSIEEQFYIVWGICLLFFQKYLRWVIAIFACVSITFILFQTLAGVGIYFHTLSYIIDMMCGAFAAYCIQRKNKIYHFINNFTKSQTFVFYMFLPLLFTIYFLVDKELTGVSYYLNIEIFRVIFIIFCSLVVMEQMREQPSVLNLSGNRFLVYTGKISYGLYCFHGFVISFGNLLLLKLDVKTPGLIQAIVYLLLTFLIASISYNYVEKPFLKLKERLRRF
ncbi:MAG: acyltransferase family protein [Ferruginibacter sp.]